MTQITINELDNNPTEYLDQELEVTGILVSCSFSALWVIGRDADLQTGKAILLQHPRLMELLIEDVPALGGEFIYYHPCAAVGTLKLTDTGTPRFRLISLKRLTVSTNLATYPVRLDQASPE